MDPFFGDNDPLSFLGESDAVEPPPPPPPPVASAGDGDGEEEEPDQPKSSRDLQRGALQELMDLVRECAALEARIESELQSTLTEAQGSGQKTLTDSERK